MIWYLMAVKFLMLPILRLWARFSDKIQNISYQMKLQLEISRLAIKVNLSTARTIICLDRYRVFKSYPH